MKHDYMISKDLVINVEYNQLESLLKAKWNPRKFHRQRVYVHPYQINFAQSGDELVFFCVHLLENFGGGGLPHGDVGVENALDLNTK